MRPLMNLLLASKKQHPVIELANGVVLRFSRPLVMSIINCTPDSFYPPSRAYSPEKAAETALMAEAEGADIADFGGESSRPGALPINAEEEIKRLIPAIKTFRRQSSLPVSADTCKAAVARLALDEGADIINDISALSDSPMAALCAERKAAVVLMHGGPAGNARACMADMAEKALASGIEKSKIILDPGFGFGKTGDDNIVLLNRLATIKHEDYPLLVGLSRKSFIGTITGRQAEDRLVGTVAANALALIAGADIIRVHDTAAAADLVNVFVAGKK